MQAEEVFTQKLHWLVCTLPLDLYRNGGDRHVAVLQVKPGLDPACALKRGRFCFAGYPAVQMEHRGQE